MGRRAISQTETVRVYFRV